MPLLVRSDAATASPGTAASKQRTAAARSHVASAQHSELTAPSSPPVHRLFIGGCPTDLSPSQLHDELQRRFQSFGSVSSVDVIKAAEGSSKGFAYVDIVSERLPVILSTFRGSQWRGRSFRVEEAKPGYLARLQQLWAQEQQDGSSGSDGSESSAAASSVVDCSAPDFCFRVRPGLRIRTRARPPCRSFPHIPALPIRALPQQGEDEEEEAEQRCSGDGATVGAAAISAAEQRQRLTQWKAEVERRWLGPEVEKARAREEPRRLSKREELKLRRQRQQAEAAAGGERSAEEEEAAPVEIESEEELGTVDFLSDDEEETKESDELTAEERQQKEEEAEWAALEGSAGSDDTEADSQPDRDRLPAATAQDDLVDDWAELERGEEEAVHEAEADDAETGPAAVESQRERETVPAFPKKSVAEWWNDEDGEEEVLASGLPSASSSAASSAAAMSRLSSALLSRSEFSVRPAYEGASGQQLLQLKRRYGGDARFALDERFALAAQQQQEQEAEQAEPEQTQAEEGKAKGESGQREDGRVLDAAALRSALHAETVRALQLLDEVAPGPTKFHMTLPRFSSAAATADGTTEPKSVEAELDAEQGRKGALMWRQMQRFDPDVEDERLQGEEQSLTQPQQTVATGEKRRREDEGRAVAEKRKEEKQSVKRDRKKRKTAAAAEEAAAAAEAREAERQQRRPAAPALYEVTVPRLRDLITDPSTVVKFSFAVDGAEAEMMDSNVIASFPTAPAPASLPPIIPAPIGLPAASSSSRARLAQRRSVQPPPPPAAPAAALPAPPSSASSSMAQQPQHRPGKLSHLLAQAQQAHTQSSAAVRGAVTVRTAAAAADEDDDADALFMRDGDVAAVEAAWRDRRAAVRTEYRKKSREAVRKEAARPGSTVTAARQPPWKAKRRAEDEAATAAAGGRRV